MAKISQPFEWSFATGPISLPYDIVSENLFGKGIFVMGFGHMVHNGYNSNVLLKATVKIGTNEECKKKWDYEYDPATQMCMVSYPGDVIDACQNDSGGPVVFKSAKDYLVAIISFGDGCGKGDPAVNVKVSAYLDWIERKCGFNGKTLTSISG